MSGSTCANDHLLLSFYYDELEVANPLGSRRGKHKLGKQFISHNHCSLTNISIRDVLLDAVKYPSSTSIFT